MIISHDRKTLFIGVPKNGSQTARAVLGPLGVDLVGEMGRHPTVPEAIRLAEARFPGEVITPTAIYAFWRDPVERFCSAVEFHKRCLPNSFIHLFPERFAGLGPHPRWFETDPTAIAQDLRAIIQGIAPVEILEALVMSIGLGLDFPPGVGNLTFYRPQHLWVDHPSVTTLPFDEYPDQILMLIDRFGGHGQVETVPHINRYVGPEFILSPTEMATIGACLEFDRVRARY